MAGRTLKWITPGTKVDITLANAFNVFDQTPSFSITIRADPGNLSQFYCGSGAPLEAFYANDSQSFFGEIPEDVMLNDNGTSGLIVYATLSGPMPASAFHVTVHQPSELPRVKGPPSPTPTADKV